MDNNKDFKVSNSLIRIIGVFETTGRVQTTVKKFIDFKYTEENIEPSNSFIKNYWYPEFRDIYFFKTEETSSTILHKTFNKELSFVVRTNQDKTEKECIQATVGDIELFLFPNNLHFFSIELTIDSNLLSKYSDLMFCSRNFNTEITDDGKDFKWVNWIENQVLAGIKISTDLSTKKVKVDEYSGSKFKLFTVIDLEEEINHKKRLELLYDVGCVSKIGTAGGNETYSPSNDYFNELMKTKISVFNNYDILPLFDTFTVLGKGLLDGDKKSFHTATWSQLYFRIFIHNLVIKFNLFRFNSEMIDDSVKVRDQFEDFLNAYNVSHISYNFLPNLIYQEHRKTLDIEPELKKFQNRINRISQAIQEQKQSRSNLLLGVVGLFTSISSIGPILSGVNNFQQKSGLNQIVFFLLLFLLILIVSISLFIFMFPDKAKKINRKWKQKKNN
jgi:hypothetical protein